MTASMLGPSPSGGDIRIDQYPRFGTKSCASATLRYAFDANDHANPALTIDSQGQITVFYSAHNGDTIHSRATVGYEDITEWLPRVEVAPQPGWPRTRCLHLSESCRAGTGWPSLAVLERRRLEANLLRGRRTTARPGMKGGFS